MSTTKRRYSKQEVADRGDSIYESQIRPHLKPEDDGKFIAIDIETGNYEIDSSEFDALQRIHARIPGSQPWLIRIGSTYVHRFGGNRLRNGNDRESNSLRQYKRLVMI